MHTITAHPHRIGVADADLWHWLLSARPRCERRASDARRAVLAAVGSADVDRLIPISSRKRRALERVERWIRGYRRVAVLRDAAAGRLTPDRLLVDMHVRVHPCTLDAVRRAIRDDLVAVPTRPGGPYDITSYGRAYLLLVDEPTCGDSFLLSRMAADGLVRQTSAGVWYPLPPAP